MRRELTEVSKDQFISFHARATHTRTHTHTVVYTATACSAVVDGCSYDFHYGRVPYRVPVLILEDTVDCGGLPIWAPYVIAVGIVFLIIILGLIILCLLKLCFVCWVRTMLEIM